MMLAMVNSKLGHMEEAQAHVAELLRISPRASVAYMRETLPYQDQDLLDRSFEALRKAGLPD